MSLQGTPPMLNCEVIRSWKKLRRSGERKTKVK